MTSSGFATHRTCAAPIPDFSGTRLNLISETLWIICALPRKVSSGSPIFMPTCSQRNIETRSEPIEGKHVGRTTGRVGQDHPHGPCRVGLRPGDRRHGRNAAAPALAFSPPAGAL